MLSSKRIREFNTALKVACDDLGAEFIDHDLSFHLQDGTINDGYLLSDGVHLSGTTTNKLFSNLKLQLRHGETSAHHVNRHLRQAPEQTKDYSEVKPDSTNGDLQYTFWQRARQKVKPLKYSGPRAHGSQPQANSGVTVALAGGPAMTLSSIANPSPALQPGGHAAVVQPFLGHPRNAVPPIIVPRLSHPHQLPDHTAIAQTVLALVVAPHIVMATELYRHLP